MIGSTFVCLGDLAQQQTAQQSQSSQLIDGMKDLSAQLQLCVLQPVSTPSLPSPLIVASPAFPVSKPDKFDGSPDKCIGFLLQC